MTNSTRFSTLSARFLLAGVATSGLMAMALPSFAHAATYAFVNQAGEVSAVVADNANLALATAFSIDEHSGVILLTSLNGNIVGTSVGVQ